MATPVPARRTRSPGVDVRPGSVRQARHEAGLSCARLAEPELSRGAIYLIETGRTRPSMSTLQLIASRTGKPVSYFLTTPIAAEFQQAAHLAASLAVAEGLSLAGQHDEAARRCEALLPRVGGDAHLESRAHRCLGLARLGLGRAEAARSHLEQARQGFTGSGDAVSAAECLVLLAQAALDDQDPGALAIGEEAVAACGRLTPVPDTTLAAAYAATGDALADQQQWDAAVDRYRLGLECARRRSSLGELAVLYEELGSASEQGQRRSLATEWRTRATTLRTAQRELGVQAEIHLKLGSALHGARQPEAAVEQFEAALAECRRLRLEDTEIRVLLAEAEICLSRGSHEAAAGLLAQVVELADAAGDRLASALARCLRGRLASATGDAETRDREFPTAIRLLTELGAHEHLVDAHIAYAGALEAGGEIAGALTHWKRAAFLARPGLEHAGTALPADAGATGHALA